MSTLALLLKLVGSLLAVLQRGIKFAFYFIYNSIKALVVFTSRFLLFCKGAIVAAARVISIFIAALCILVIRFLSLCKSVVRFVFLFTKGLIIFLFWFFVLSLTGLILLVYEFFSLSFSFLLTLCKKLFVLLKGALSLTSLKYRQGIEYWDYLYLRYHVSRYIVFLLCLFYFGLLLFALDKLTCPQLVWEISPAIDRLIERFGVPGYTSIFKTVFPQNCGFPVHPLLFNSRRLLSCDYELFEVVTIIKTIW